VNVRSPAVIYLQLVSIPPDLWEELAVLCDSHCCDIYDSACFRFNTLIVSRTLLEAIVRLFSKNTHLH